jgi:hypothetical protein
MPISPLSQKTRRYLAAVNEARATGVDADELFETREAIYQAELTASLERQRDRQPQHERTLERLDDDVSRRRFLAGSAAAIAGTTAFGILGRTTRAAAAAPRIAVVGAGFAGMAAAWEVHRARGWPIHVYEGQHRVGGRARTIRTLAKGKYTEAGPSGISSNEQAIQALLKRLGLWPMVDTWLHYPKGPELYASRA